MAETRSKDLAEWFGEAACAGCKHRLVQGCCIRNRFFEPAEVLIDITSSNVLCSASCQVLLIGIGDPVEPGVAHAKNDIPINRRAGV